MLRLDALEKSLPREWRDTIRDHPWICLGAAALAGVYLGRNHGRALFSALTTDGIAVGAEKLKVAAGLSGNGAS